MKATTQDQAKKPPHRLPAASGGAASASVLAQLAALKDAPAPALKARWRELFDSEPPPYNRRFLENRLAYRLQELVHGVLSAEAHRRLKAAAVDLPAKRSKAGKRVPVIVWTVKDLTAEERAFLRRSAQAVVDKGLGGGGVLAELAALVQRPALPA